MGNICSWRFSKMISLVIPVFRSAESLTELFERIAAVARDNSWDFEVIFVEDCGGDNSWNVIQGLAANNTNIRGFKMSRNYGQHNALLCGIREAKGEIIVTLDDDLQHPPEEIPKLVGKLEQGFDVVYGPPKREAHGFLRDMASKITKFVLQSAMGAKNARQACSFRVMRRDIREAFSMYCSPTVSIDVLLTWGTTKFSFVSVSHEERRNGISGYTTRKLIAHAFNMMTGFSSRPLQYASLIGFLFALFGLVILAYVLVLYFFRGSEVPGFAFLASIISIFSGAQLLALGVIGEYLARMHFRTMNQPAYVVREIVVGPSKKPQE
jgi:glycosyltransferase involved in cell wall biosynthesis